MSAYIAVVLNGIVPTQPSSCGVNNHVYNCGWSFCGRPAGCPLANTSPPPQQTNLSFIYSPPRNPMASAGRPSSPRRWWQRLGPRHRRTMTNWYKTTTPRLLFIRQALYLRDFLLFPTPPDTPFPVRSLTGILDTKERCVTLLQGKLHRFTYVHVLLFYWRSESR